MGHRVSEVRVQLRDSQMQELCRMYDLLISSYPTSEPHRLLLKMHIKELRDRIRKQLDGCRKKYTVKLEGSDLLAFVQIWESRMLELFVIEMTEFRALIIQSFFNKLDQQNKMRRIQYG